MKKTAQLLSIPLFGKFKLISFLLDWFLRRKMTLFINRLNLESPIDGTIQTVKTVDRLAGQQNNRVTQKVFTQKG